jgi:hypothetical protein
MRRYVTLLAIAAIASPASADVKVYKNDNLPTSGGFGQIACQAGFVSNEIGASVYTVPAGDGLVMLIENSWWVCDGSGLGLAQSRPMQSLVYAGGFPNPGSAIYTSPQLSSQVGFLNLWPVVDAGLTFSAGQSFTVGTKLLPGNLFQNFATLATDTNGCQAGKNLIFAVPGGWTDACSFGVSGDMFVRTKVVTNGPIVYGSGLAGTNGVPQIGFGGGPWYVGNDGFFIKCTSVKPNSPGLIGISAGTASIPLFGGTLLIDPLGVLYFTAISDAGGVATTAAGLPNDPNLVDKHVYFQYGFFDLGAPQAISLSAGLDLEISANQ